VFSNTRAALINFAVIRHVGRHNDCFFFKAAGTAQWTRTTSKHQSIFFFNNIDVFKVTKFPLTENDNNKKIKLPLKQQP
jgi:hypothetical protein